MNNVISFFHRLLKGTAPRTFVKGNIRQAVCYGPFRSLPLEMIAEQLLEMGIIGLDLVDPDEWEAVRRTGLLVTLSRVPGASGASIVNGFNHVGNHHKLAEIYSDLIPKAEKSEVKNLICFSGNRNGMSDDEGIRNCISGLQRIMPLAEKHGVTLVMELLNRQDHEDYHADRTAFGAEIARGIGSEHFKLLYDIYHQQISEGNLIDTIQKNRDVIGHYHTAGVPGRQDLDEDQEINCPAVMRTIVKTGFTGCVAHEFNAKKANQLESIRDAIKVCDVF